MIKISEWLKKQTKGLTVIIFTAVLLEAISAIQYEYTRNMLEEEMEQQVLTELIASALRIQRVLSNSEIAAINQVWHVERHLDNSDEISTIVHNLVKDTSDEIIGAGIGFMPNFYPEKGLLFEPYAVQLEDTVRIRQIAGPWHDYTKTEFYNNAMNNDTTRWTYPYFDDKGAGCVVTSYALPVHDKENKPIGVFAVDLAIDWISEVVNKNHSQPSSFTIVLTEKGELIAPPSDSLAKLTQVKRIVNMINDSTVERGLKANGRVTSFPFYDEDIGKDGHVYYATKKERPHWQIAVVCYDHEVFGELNKIQRYTFWLEMLGILLIGIIIQLFVRSLRSLQKTRSVQERIKNELNIAREIQMQMLPRVNSIKRDDIDVAGLLVPAREVSGDLFDFFIRNEKLFFCIGDVSGKGVPSALVMSVTHSAFRSASTHENNPARIMQTINQTSCNGNESGMFVTLFIGVLDLPTGRLHYCNAGHDIPFVIGENVNELPVKANVPVGIFNDHQYVGQEYVLKPMSTFFLYTDGLTEAKNIRRQQFGIQRLKKILEFYRSSAPTELLELMKKEVQRYAEQAEQSDDLTMLAIHYTPQQEMNTLDETLLLKNNIKEVPELNRFVKDVAERLDIGTSLSRQLRLAVEEAVVNIINYAYPEGTTGYIRVEAKSNGKRIKFIITDEGVPFDPTEVFGTDISIAAENRPVGGLGIMLVRKVMDTVNYERIDGKNVLTLRKKIPDNENMIINS